MEVEDVGCEGAVTVGGGGDGGELGRVEGGGEVHVCFEEFGAAAVVEVHGGEDDVDAGGLPVWGNGGLDIWLCVVRVGQEMARSSNIH